jgi:hypothetical protein
MVDKLLLGAGCLFLVYGFFGLVGTWLVPALGQSRLYGAGMFMGRMEPSRVNRTIMSLWALFFGGYFAASFSGHRTLGYISFLAFMLCAIAALVIRYRRSCEA